MGTNKISVHQIMEYGQAVGYLEALVEGAKAGQIVVEHGGTALNLAPSAIVDVKVEAKQKRDKEKFVIEISWRPQAEFEALLRISNSLPGGSQEGMPTVIAAAEEKAASTAGEEEPAAKESGTGRKRRKRATKAGSGGSDTESG